MNDRSTDRPAPAEDEAAVRAANDALYTAFATLDMDAMARVWAQRPDDICTHPGWEPMRGWREIRESWRAIFANVGYMRFSATDVEVELLGDVARVSCTENLYNVVEGMTVQARVAATNLFARIDGEWKLILHHGSPIAGSESVQEVDEDDVN